MGNETVYFDSAASTQVHEDVLAAMVRFMRDDYGNPSSMHSRGRGAEAALRLAREHIAGSVSVDPKNVIFTSGGTEANNLAIFGVIDRLSHRGKHIITSEIEHSAVFESMKKLESSGFEVTYLSPDEFGRIPPRSFADALREDTVFASIMHVNNEIGSLNPIEKYAREIKRRKLGTILHTDAVQSFCKIPFSFTSLGADLVSVSSHKLHGPMGVGALIISDKVRLSPALLGGGQEYGRRAGTEPLSAIIGFGEAVKIAHSEAQMLSENAGSLRDFAVSSIEAELPEAVIIGEGDSPYIMCLALSGFKGEVLMNYLDGEGICVSRGSACKKGTRSRVLEAMKLKNAVIDGAIRVSFSRYNTREEVERLVDVLKTATKTLAKTK
ncbi:MAG: cysteine desulfurase [Oscillospiraceae bacterium]|nr:cysteine desulfurase [Oscillospiraceae bacterium]